MEEHMRIEQCRNIKDFRLTARRRLPGPISHYIDGAADDEVTYRRNTEAYERCDLVPDGLAGVESIDMSVTVMGHKLEMPLFRSPTALQRLFHHDGEGQSPKPPRSSARCLAFRPWGTVSVEEMGSTIRTPNSSNCTSTGIEA
jgi:L-lactate dehydrogenase (cytochrome)